MLTTFILSLGLMLTREWSTRDLASPNEMRETRIVQNSTSATEKGLDFADLPPLQGLETPKISPEVAKRLYQTFPRKQAQRYLAQLNNEFNKLNSRWTSGAKPAEFLTLGDFQDSLKLQNLSIGTISELSGQSLERTPISEFSLLSQQKLGQLVNNVPGLKNQTVGSVPFIQDAMKAGDYNPNRVSNLTIKNVMEAYPRSSEISLNEMNLEKYMISEIPGIEQMTLGKMSGWQDTTIASVPGLSSVPVNQLGAKATGGIVGQIHWVLGDIEKPSRSSISGSYQEGFAVPCSQKCAHIEVGTNPLAAGKQWISGRESVNQVSGGEGFLKFMFGGKEPTGRHPFGKGFKVVVWEIDESQGTVSTAWFFRICQTGLGCSPYGIGPIPGFTYKEGDWIFLGL